MRKVSKLEAYITIQHIELMNIVIIYRFNSRGLYNWELSSLGIGGAFLEQSYGVGVFNDVL
jgi:hypothetical protein